MRHASEACYLKVWYATVCSQINGISDKWEFERFLAQNWLLFYSQINGNLGEICDTKTPKWDPMFFRECIVGERGFIAKNEPTANGSPRLFVEFDNRVMFITNTIKMSSG